MREHPIEMIALGHANVEWKKYLDRFGHGAAVDPGFPESRARGGPAGQREGSYSSAGIARDVANPPNRKGSFLNIRIWVTMFQNVIIVGHSGTKF